MMLLGGSQPDVKQVAVVTRNPRFTRLFCSILADWKFFAVEDLSAATVVFAERGLALPAHAAQVAWLSPMPLAEGFSLTTPISLTQLYHLLEVHFFPTPRRYIRVAVDFAVDLKIAEAWLTGRLVSLSERGGRVECAAEIPRGRVLHLEVSLPGKLLKVAAEVLYCIPGGDTPGCSLPQIGVLFKPSSDQEFNMLRHLVEKTCIENACAREGIAFNDPCISWFEVPVDPWKSKR